MSTQRIGKKQINFYATDAEYELLEDHCDRTGRGKTEILREFIRSLPTYKED